jgi:hypothetical protein
MLPVNHHIDSNKYKTEIVSNSCYEILFDSSKNRIFLCIKGFWKNRDAVSDFLENIKKALSLTNPGFTILTDLQLMITHPQELNSLHEEAHNLIMEAGVRLVAHVVPADKIANLQTNSIAQTTGLPVHNFSTTHEAEEWLDKGAFISN